MTIGTRISALRKQKGLSQEYLAEQLEVSRQAVSKWEHDLTSPDMGNLIKLAQLFEVTVEYLAAGDSEKTDTDTDPRPKVHTGNKILIVCLIFTLCAAVVFCSLWVYEKNNKADMEWLCSASADACAELLREYQKSGSESQYWSAVGEFRTFMQAYHSIAEDANKIGNYNICSSVYGHMLVKPEKVQNNIAELISAMELLSKNIWDYNGHNLMYNLYITLEHG